MRYPEVAAGAPLPPIVPILLTSLPERPPKKPQVLSQDLGDLTQGILPLCIGPRSCASSLPGPRVNLESTLCISLTHNPCQGNLCLGLDFHSV